MKGSSLAKAALLLLFGNAAMAEERVPLQMVTQLREIVRSAMDKEAKKTPKTEVEDIEGKNIEGKNIEFKEGKDIETIRFEGALTATDEVKVPAAAKPEDDEYYKQQENLAIDPQLQAAVIPHGMEVSEELGSGQVATTSAPTECPRYCVTATRDGGGSSRFCFRGLGGCLNNEGRHYDRVSANLGDCADFTDNSPSGCAAYCVGLPTARAPTLQGFTYLPGQLCHCWFDYTDDNLNFLGSETCRDESRIGTGGTGPVGGLSGYPPIGNPPECFALV